MNAKGKSEAFVDVVLLLKETRGGVPLNGQESSSSAELLPRRVVQWGAGGKLHLLNLSVKQF